MTEKTINVLLLGETGVGKSTFINMLANYLTYNNLDEAASKKMSYLVPLKFSYIDDDFNEHEIITGTSENEITKAGSSSTQNPKSYLYRLNDQNEILRVIDTPGIGDTRGLLYDEWNTEKLLTFISELEYLNAICIILKPNNSRFTVLFDYCMKQILLRLDKRIKDNIVFLFTNARSSFYKPGDTYVPLKQLLKQTESGSLKATIPFNSNNVFCIDNESFRYLAARSAGVLFDDDSIQEYRASWNKSSAIVKKMLQYWASLDPVPMQGIVSINESRRIIMRLGKPVVDLMVLYEKVLIRLAEHEEDLQESKDNITELKSKLYIPVMETYLKEKVVVSDSHVEHGFSFGVGLTVVKPYIQKLEVDYKNEDCKDGHVEEKFSAREKIVRDPQIEAMLSEEKDVNKALKREIEKLKSKSEEYKSEAKTVLTIVAKFITFLKENAMVLNSDPFQIYLESAIKEETVDENNKLSQSLQRLLNRYKIKKEITSEVRAEDIRDAMYELISLKNTGTTFKQIMEKKYKFNDQQSITQ